MPRDVPINDDRAEWAARAIDTFREAVGSDDDAETILVDLLTDLNHWATLNAIDWHAALEQAASHYFHEITYPDA